VRLLDRLVGGTFLRLFVVSVLATPPLFILGHLTERLDDYLDSGLTSLEIAHGYLYNVPEYLAWSFPIAGLIAAVFTVHGMTTHREVVAAKAGGVSFHRLILPLLLLGLVMTGVALAATDLVPLSKRRAAEILEQRSGRRDWRSAFTYQTEEGLVLSVQRMDAPQRRMTTIGLYRSPSEEHPTTVHAHADLAVYDTLGWTFETGAFRRVWPDGVESAMTFRSMRVPGLKETPEDLLVEPRDEEEMTYDEIARQARIVERSGGNASQLRVKQEQKLAIPVATFVIILFGAPLATSSKRGGAAYGIGISLGSTILYILMLKVAAGFGASGAIPPLWAAWAPNAAFFLMGVVLMVRVRT
jgi:lipopolysaccharide export system permease protein